MQEATKNQFFNLRTALLSLEDVETELDHCTEDFSYSQDAEKSIGTTSDVGKYYKKCRCPSCRISRESRKVLLEELKKERECCHEENYNCFTRTLERLEEEYQGPKRNSGPTWEKRYDGDSDWLSKEGYDKCRKGLHDYFINILRRAFEYNEQLWSVFSDNFSTFNTFVVISEFFQKPLPEKNRELLKGLREIYKTREDFVKSRSVEGDTLKFPLSEDSWRERSNRDLLRQIRAEVDMAALLRTWTEETSN